MNIEPVYKPRFLTADEFTLVLEMWRMTTVGHVNWRPTRHERMLRAVDMLFERVSPATSKTGAYKDLSCALENV